jgi:hypothetical protein
MVEDHHHHHHHQLKTARVRGGLPVDSMLYFAWFETATLHTEGLTAVAALHDLRWPQLQRSWLPHGRQISVTALHPHMQIRFMLCTC